MGGDLAPMFRVEAPDPPCTMQCMQIPNCGYLNTGGPTEMANPIQVDVNALPNIPVQIEIRSDGKVVWVHVNGYTVVRINDVSAVEIIDNRKEAL